MGLANKTALNSFYYLNENITGDHIKRYIVWSVNLKSFLLRVLTLVFSSRTRWRLYCPCEGCRFEGKSANSLKKELWTTSPNRQLDFLLGPKDIKSWITSLNYKLNRALKNCLTSGTRLFFRKLFFRIFIQNGLGLPGLQFLKLLLLS
jgi:hypothetical protein